MKTTSLEAANAARQKFMKMAGRFIGRVKVESVTVLLGDHGYELDVLVRVGDHLRRVPVRLH